jgi:phage/plasmid-like protein (TIGR03299 family)
MTMTEITNTPEPTRQIGHNFGDITLIGNGGSHHATESLVGAIPFSRVRDLFDFTVSYTPVYTVRPDAGFVEVPNRHALVRDGADADVAPLNIVSKRYGIHQFSEVLIDNLLTLTDTPSSDLEIVGAGLLSNGAVGWVQVQAPEITVTGDGMAPTITLASSHNGTFATQYRVGMFRFACSNQLGALHKGTGNVYKLRHTLNSRVRFTEARAALGLLHQSADDFRREVESLVATTVTDAQFGAIRMALDPRPVGNDVSVHAMTRWENRQQSLRTLWNDDDRVAPYRNTAWGVVQAYSTWRQNIQSFRANSESGTVSRAGRNMQDFLSGRCETQDTRVVDVTRMVLAR